MVKQGIVALLAVPFLCAPLAFAEQAGDFEGKDPGAWHQNFCIERYARKAARLAYLEAKLNLAAEQKPAFGKWRQVKTDAAEKRRTACQQRDWSKIKSETAVEREARVEKWLSERLQELQASRPALQALYEALTPEQKALFDQATRWQGWRGHRHGGWFGRRDGEGPRWRWHGWQQEGQEQPGQE